MSVSRRIKLFFTIVLLLGLTVFYPFVVYTTNPFVSELRTLWIATAMETMTHQWLATAFFPQDMVAEVVEARTNIFEEQANIESIWGQTAESTVDKAEAALTEQDKFYTLFPELDRESCETFLAEHPQYVEDGYDSISFDWCDKSSETGVLTRQGDMVQAINTQKSLMIVRIERETSLGTEYNGNLAIVKDPSRVSLGLCRGMGRREGQRLVDLVDYNDAILGINASGFIDNGEAAEGGTPYGYVKKDGEQLNPAFGSGYKIIGFDAEHRFQIGGTKTAEKLVDAVEFGPALILNGDKLEIGTHTSLQPRTAIGQTDDLTVLMLVINGRGKDDSLGCRAADCRDILWDYGAVQACNLDGGSSTAMVYQGRTINAPTTSSNNADGRRLPNAFIVK